jgi:phenylacetate-CoA ligase
VLEVRRQDRLDELEVVVELKRHHGDDAATAMLVADDLARTIKGYVGVTARVRVAAVGEVERSMGKAKRVIDLRGR